MKNYFIIVLFVLMALSGCEEVIDVNLNDSDPRLVIQANYYDYAKEVKAILSYSKNYFGQEDTRYEGNASVMFKAESDTEYTQLQYIGEGIYRKDYDNPLPGELYEMRIVIGDSILTAFSKMINPISLDSIYVNDTTGWNGEEEIEGFNLAMYLTDPIEIKNFAIVKFETTGSSIIYQPYYAFDDFVFNGLSTSFNWGEVYSTGDTVVMDFINCDRRVYDFYLVMMEALNGGGFYSLPDNPESNFDMDVLGYFNAAVAYRDTIVISSESFSFVP